MKNKYYYKWLKYYLKLNNRFKIFYFQTIKLLEILNSSVYLEHSISIKYDNISKFRGLICLSDIDITEFKYIFLYLNSLSNFNLNNIKYIIFNLKNKKYYYNDIIIWFDFWNLNNRVKFYFTTKNNLLLTWSLFEWLEFKNIIKWYDILLESKKIVKKEYILLDKNEIYNNKNRIINIFWNKVFSLLEYVYWLNISLKENGNFISLDFKFNWNKNFIYLLKNTFSLNLENLWINLNKTSFISIKYDFDKNNLDINNYNLYFYE